MKAKRDITLGEMQDECNRCGCCALCNYREYCPNMTDLAPKHWNLTDHPRFSDEAMALLRGFKAIGAVSVQEVSGWFSALDKDGIAINIARSLNLCGQTLDLAELLGEGTNAK